MKNDFLLIQPDKTKTFRIGRKSDCDLVLEDRYVSREHAEISFTKETWFVKNLSHSSGTQCNGISIEIKELEDGDVLFLGTQKLSVSIKNQILQILVIQKTETSPIIFSKENTAFIGRKTDSPNAQIHSSACPNFLAKAKNENNKVKFQFTTKLYSPTKKISRNFTLNSEEKILLPWCSLEHKDSFLFLHQQLPGFSVEAKNISVTIKEKQLLKNINFYVGKGEILSVIGRSGQGKSTLLRLLSGVNPLDKNSSLLINGISHKNSIIRQYIAFLEQEPKLRSKLTVKETLENAITIKLPKDTNSKEKKELLEKFLDLLGLTHLENHKTNSLSGGENRRVALACELIGSPGIILLDEPLAGLDPVNIKILCHHLRRLSLLGYTIILTTHGYEALEISHKVLVLHEGNEAFFGTPQEAFIYFNTASPVKMLQSLKKSTIETWETSPLQKRIFPEQKESSNFLFPKISHPSSFILYFKILLKQHTRDLGKVLALVFQPLIIGFLFSQVFSASTSLWVVAFALVLSGNWFSLSLAVREIVQEKNLLLNEIRQGVSKTAILSSKFIFISGVSFLQTLVCYFFIQSATPISVPYHFLLLLLALTILPATALGLLVSSAAKNTGQANILLPLLIIPQVILSGALVPIDQMSSIGRIISQFIPSRYNLSALKDLFLGTQVALGDWMLPILFSMIFYIIAWRLLANLGKAK